MTDVFWLPLLVGGTISALVTPLVARIAARNGIVDRPETAPERKQHKQPVPLLGGVALFITVLIGAILYFGTMTSQSIHPSHFIAVLVALGILTVGGGLDDRFNLRPSIQLLFPIAAILTVIIAGLGITYIDNPIGPDIDFATSALPAAGFTFIWLLIMTYTTKLLDGLDGLVPGLGVIGSIILFLVSMRPEVMQEDTAMIAALFAGACLGFLLWNWHPARIFLGEGGSTMVGFMLGVLAIISGAKIATTLLIVALPLTDFIIVVIRRIAKGHNPLTRPDRRHVHQRLVDNGMATPKAAIILLSTSAALGVSALLLSREHKGYLILVGTIFVVLLAIWRIKTERQST